MPERDLEQTRTILETWLGTVAPAPRIEVDELTLPAAGASNETILFRATWHTDDGEHQERLVLRVQPVAYQLFLNGDVFHQSRALEAMAAHPEVPVPVVRWKEPSSDVLGAPFYVMLHCDGDVPNGYQSRMMQDSTPAQRTALLENGLEVMARLHQVDWREGFQYLHAGEADPGLASYLDWVEQWYDWARAGRHFETVERGLRLLRDQMPAGSTASLCWGDSRPGNIMFSPVDQSVVAVLDWELLQIATPEADLAWWMMFERLFSERMGGAPEGALTRDQTLARYEACIGRPLIDIGYFDVLAWLRLSMTFIRHVDLEVGGPREAMFTELAAWVNDQLAAAIDARS
jgi:aminoglycoside phosphotransferase (APT) family kinase protein